MRVVYLNEDLMPASCGITTETAQHTDRCLRHLRASGHRVQLLRPRRPGESPFENSAEWRCCATAPALHSALRQRWRHDPPDLLHVASGGRLAWAALLAARACGVATSADFRGHADLPRRGYRPGLLAPLRHALTRRLHAAADCSFVPDAQTAAALAARGFGGLCVLEPGVDPRAFAPAWRDAWMRRAWHAEDSDLVLLYAGELSATHNVRLALNTYERLRRERHGLHMIVVGDGPLRERLEQQHPRVRFAGARHGSDLACHYASADLMLCPDLSGDGGSAALAGLASGLAVVAFDNAAAARHMETGRNGWLAPAGDAEAFVACARRALPGAVAGSALRREARERALGLGWATALNGFERELTELVSRRARRDTAAVVPA